MINNWLSAYQWAGPNPYTLLILPAARDVETTFIDLDTSGWATTHEALMRAPGHWHLVRKEDGLTALTVLVHEGEQPYYTARHMGVAGSGGSNEIIAYGIGKKCVDGSMVRLWVMPNGEVVGGDDVDEYGILMVKALGPKQTG